MWLLLYSFHVNYIRSFRIKYGANNSKDFKDKLRCYEIMNKSSKRLNYTKRNEKDLPKDKNFEIKCFNCGGKGHKSNNCDSKSKGTKCFNCEKFSHISKDCPRKKGESNNIQLLNVYDDDIMMKIIKIGDVTTNALFDTGSKFNVMRKSIFRKLQKSSPDCIRRYQWSINSIIYIYCTRAKSWSSTVKIKEDFRYGSHYSNRSNANGNCSRYVP